MIGTKTCDLFITHAWRYHDDWKRLVNLLNAHDVKSWRNFSLPWYDPALDPRTEAGGKIVRWGLETQIIPVEAVLLLASLYTEPGTRKWLDFELQMARKHKKPVLAIPAWGETDVTPEVRAAADLVVSWDAKAILATVADQRARQTAAA
jgi:hypothetical protein